METRQLDSKWAQNTQNRSPWSRISWTQLLSFELTLSYRLSSLAGCVKSNVHSFVNTLKDCTSRRGLVEKVIAWLDPLHKYKSSQWREDGAGLRSLFSLIGLLYVMPSIERWFDLDILDVYCMAFQPRKEQICSGVPLLLLEYISRAISLLVCFVLIVLPIICAWFGFCNRNIVL